jgi:hypothetical protein
MRLQQTIKQLLALAMLVVFAFSITPQVATTPFVNYNFSIDIPAQNVARAQNDFYNETRNYTFPLSKDSRGPPHC